MAESPVNIQEASSLSGAGLLALVTTGMYDNPLSMYREYIQNAADAVERIESAEKPSVTINIDVVGRSVRIRDNGPGLSYEEALKRLLPIGRSDKTLGTDRGFRGIGRLAGLAFAKSVSFTTRTHKDAAVTRITWHSERIPELTATEAELEDAIQDCVNIETVETSEYPSHFFEVEVQDVARHSAGLLLNRDVVGEYLSEVCPVPINPEFRFTSQVEELFDGAASPLTLKVLLSGDTEELVRPHGASVHLSANSEAEFTDFQEVRIPAIDGKGDAAVGWIAHSSYLGAIPKEQRIRGIRARVGNIQVGDDAVFDNLFTEERFNRWCVGEIHILDTRIIPNARRDYFESCPHLRHLENQLRPFMRSISTRCRRESSARNRARKAYSALHNIDDLKALASSGYLNADDSSDLVKEALKEIGQVREEFTRSGLDCASIKRLDEVEAQLMAYPGCAGQPVFDNMDELEAAVYQRVFATVVKLVPSPGSARELIETVLAETSSRTSDN